MEALSDTGGPVTLSAFIVTHWSVNGKWNVNLPADGFTPSSTTFTYTGSYNGITANPVPLRSYSKILPVAVSTATQWPSKDSSFLVYSIRCVI